MNSPLQGGKRRRRQPRRWPLVLAAIVGLAAIAAGVTLFLTQNGGGGGRTPAAIAHVGTRSKPKGKPKLTGKLPRRPPPGISLAGGDTVHMHLHPNPAAALLFDMNTGRVLWRLHPMRVRPIASVTKMMTALLVTERLPYHGRAKVKKDALRYTGSEVGVLPRNRRVPIRTLLYGLLLPSGNDAAVALADRIAGTDRRFAKLMNRRAHALGLSCTHYVSSYGLQDGNRSCPADIASLARIVMRKRRIAHIVRQEHARVWFPWLKGKHLDLYTTNSLLRVGYRGTIGLKTGFTDPAGQCLVAVVRRGGHTLGLVLLHSPDTATQGRQIMDAGFRALRRGG